MKIPLSPRLQACCSLVSVGDRVADIGTDHGYLGIWLLHNKIASSVIASDIVPGPLSAAKRNAIKYNCADKMEFFLSDGAASIPRDFTCMVCAGMGADTIVSILTQAPWLKHNKYKLILQCQSKTHVLRQYLSQNGWHIKKEILLRDGRFLYTVMEVIFQSAVPLTPGQCFISPALRNNVTPELSQYYQHVCKNLHLSVDNKGDLADPMLSTALTELENDPTLQHLKEDNNGNR